MGQSAGSIQDEQRGLPVPNSTQSYWRSELHPIDSYRSSEELPTECDIAIIGAGMTGASIAYHLSQLHSTTDKKPSIVILEAREVSSGATGRNGGHSKIRSSSIAEAIEKQGLEAAEEYAAFVYEQKYLMREVVEKENLDCEFEFRRSYDVFLQQDEADKAEKLYRTAVREGHKWVKDVDFVGPKYVEQVTSNRNAKAALSIPVCSLWPYKFVSQLLSRLLDLKAITLYTHTPVLSLTPHPHSTSLLTPNNHTISAKKVIFATNAYTPFLCNNFKDKITPYKGTACHITPEEKISPHLSHTYNIYHTHPAREESRVDYLNPRPNSSIVVGGGKHVYASSKQLWYNTFDDSTLLPNTPAYFENYMQDRFKGWGNSNAKVDFLWTGIQGETKDGRPFVGKVGDGGWWVCAGFNGGGMSLIFGCARGVAEMVEGKEYKETGLPEMFDAERVV